MMWLDTGSLIRDLVMRVCLVGLGATMLSWLLGWRKESWTLISPTNYRQLSLLDSARLGTDDYRIKFLNNKMNWIPEGSIILSH